MHTGRQSVRASDINVLYTSTRRIARTLLFYFLQIFTFSGEISRDIRGENEGPEFFLAKFPSSERSARTYAPPIDCGGTQCDDPFRFLRAGQTVPAVFLTGAAHTGRAITAQRPPERFGCPYPSIDRPNTDPIRCGRTALPGGTAGPERASPSDLAQMIRTAAVNRKPLPAEGCSIFFDWRLDFFARCLPSMRILCPAIAEGSSNALFDAVRRHASATGSGPDDFGSPMIGLKTGNRRIIEGDRKAVLIRTDFEQTISSGKWPFEMNRRPAVKTAAGAGEAVLPSLQLRFSKPVQ